MGRRKSVWGKILMICVTGLLMVAGWRVATGWKEARLCERVEQAMEEAYAIKNSSEGQKLVAKLGVFPILYGDLVVLAQETLSYRIQDPQRIRPPVPEEIQFAFNDITFKALMAMAAKERGAEIDWNEVRERKTLEYEAWASDSWRSGARCGVARSRLRHLEGDRVYHTVLVAATEVISREEREDAQRIDIEKRADVMRQLAAERVQVAVKKYPLVIYDTRFKQPPWVAEIGGSVSPAVEDKSTATRD